MKTQAPTQSDSSTTPRPSLWTTLKAFPRPVWIVFLGVFINRFGTFVIPFLALHMTKLGFSVKQTGMALAAYGGGHLAASMIGGHLADTIGRRNTIVLSMFSAGTTMLCLSQAESLTAIIALACLAGVTAEFYKPASSALLADLTSPANRVMGHRPGDSRTDVAIFLHLVVRGRRDHLIRFRSHRLEMASGSAE
jgi:MFS family permease